MPGVIPNVFAKDAPPPVNKCPQGTATGTREPVPTLVWVTVPTQGDAGQAVLHKLPRDTRIGYQHARACQAVRLTTPFASEMPSIWPQHSIVNCGGGGGVVGGEGGGLGRGGGGFGQGEGGLGLG